MQRKVRIVYKDFCLSGIHRLCLQMLTAYCQHNPEYKETRNSMILIHNYIVNTNKPRFRVTRNPESSTFKIMDLISTTYLLWENIRPFYKATLFYRFCQEHA